MSVTGCNFTQQKVLCLRKTEDALRCYIERKKGGERNVLDR